MTLIDAVNVPEIEQTEVDPNTHATTIHTKLSLPDGGVGFLIIGRVVADKKKKWLPLRDVISKVLIEYDAKYDPIQTPPKKDSLLSE